MAEVIEHPKCGKTWTGNAAEHCPDCCQTFSSTTAGDVHRLGPRSKYPWSCVPDYMLSCLGLWKNPRGVWGFGTPEGYAARVERAAAMRAAKKGKTESIADITTN